MPSASISEAFSGTPSDRKKAATVSCRRLHSPASRRPAVSQKNGAVRLGVHIAGLLQPRQRAIDRHMRHAQPPRQVHHARLAQAGRQIGDGLDVILRSFRRRGRAANGGSFRPAAQGARRRSRVAAGGFRLERGMTCRNKANAGF